MTSLQPVDQLKKGPFSLQAAVLGYRQVEEGVEVQVRLAASSQGAGLVWQSVLTLLSRKRVDIRRAAAGGCDALRAGQGALLVELSVPPAVCFWSRFWSWSWFSVLGSSSAAEWMLSVCLAEAEKRKGNVM